MYNNLTPEELKRKKYFEEYKKIGNFYRYFNESLRVLKKDMSLLREGFKFYIAVDFHQIYNFSYPIFKDYTDKTDIKVKDIRNKLSETFVFNHREYKILDEEYSETVLLPPYINELVSYIDYLTTATQEVKREMELVLSSSDAIFNERGLGIFQKLIAQIEKNAIEAVNPQLKDSQLDKLVRAMQENFPEIYLVLSTSPADPSTILSDLFSDENSKVKLLGDIFSEEEMQFVKKFIEHRETFESNEQEVKFDGLLNSFDDVRSGRKIQNLNDATAIYLICKLNKEFNTKEKIKLLLYSDAISIKKVLDKYSLTDEILRNSYYFVDYLTMVGKNVEETIQNIDNKISDIHDFFTWETVINKIQNCSQECYKCKISEQCSKTSNQFIEHLKFYEDYSTLRMIENKKAILRPIKDAFDKLVPIESEEYKKLKQNLKDFLDFIFTKNQVLGDKFDKKITDEIGKLKENGKKIKKEIINEIIKQPISEDNIHQLVIDFRRFAGIPWTVHFVDKGYIEKTNDFYTLIRNKFEDIIKKQNSESERPSELQNKFKEILNLIKNDGDDYEKWDKMLLKILLLFGFHEYKYSLFMVEFLLDELNVASQRNNENLNIIKREALLFNLLILSKLIDDSEHKRTYFINAKETIKKYEKEAFYKDDPRFCNLKGSVYYLGYKNNIESQDNTLKMCLTCYEEALNKYEKNKTFQNDYDNNKYFKIALLNNILYTKLIILENKKKANEEIEQKDIDEMTSTLENIENEISNKKLENIMYEVTHTIAKTNLLLYEIKGDKRYLNNAKNKCIILYNVINITGLKLLPKNKEEIESLIKKIDEIM